MARKPSITQIEVFLLSAKAIMDTDIPDDMRDRMYGVMAEVDAFRRTDVDIADHRPIYVSRDLYPAAMQQIGCTCGERPKKPNQRMSTMMSFYNGHLSRIGIARPDRPLPVTYADGPYAGMTWDEASDARRAAEATA